MSLSIMMVMFSLIVLIVLVMTSEERKNSIYTIFWTAIFMLHILRLVGAL